MKNLKNKKMDLNEIMFSPANPGVYNKGYIVNSDYGVLKIIIWGDMPYFSVRFFSSNLAPKFLRGINKAYLVDREFYFGLDEVIDILNDNLFFCKSRAIEGFKDHVWEILRGLDKIMGFE